MNRSAAFLLVLIAALSACAGPGPQRRDEAPPVSGSADQLAAAALRIWATQHDASRALTLIERAAEDAGDRADIAWLHVRLCMEARGCEPQPIETRLRKLDPGNGVVWLGVLSQAQARRDERTAQSVLEAMSHAERFDLYWTTLVWRLTAAIDSAMDAARAQSEPQSAPRDAPQNLSGNAPLTTALNEVIGWLSSLATPAFEPVTSACDPKRAPKLTMDAGVRASCERIAAAMQRSDTTLVEGLGLGIAQRLAAPDSAVATALDERVATLAYQSEAAGSIVRAQVERDKFSTQMLELMKKLRREQEVSIAILRWAGRSLTPAD